MAADPSVLFDQEESLESYLNKIATIDEKLTDLNREMETFKEYNVDKWPTYKWRIDHTRTAHQYDFMRRCKIQTDCQMKIVSESEEAPYVLSVHRLQLMRASPVFEAMLMDDMLEAKTGEITITDLSPKAIRRLIYYIYYDEVKLNTFEEACEVAFAAEKYQIKHLRDISVSFVLKLLSPENIWTALKLANILGLTNLRENCIEMLQLNTIKCIASEEFLQTPEENVIILLNQDELSIESELVLVNATISWARQEAQRRGLPGDDAGVRSVIEPNILRLLRLSTIPLEQFKTGPGLSDWLTRSDKEQIMEHQEIENSLNLPEYLSSSKQQRQLVNEFGEYLQRKFHLCKRKVITTLENLKHVTPVRQCNLCHSLFEIQGTEFETEGNCLHAIAVFRPRSKCRLFGFECPGRVFNNTDPTFIASKDRPFYYENMQIFVINKGSSLSRSPLQPPLETIFEIKYTEKTTFNSTISIKFPEAVKLVENNWYMIIVVFLSFEENLPVEYPYCTRPKQVVSTSENVKIRFKTRNIPGYWSSVNDGFFKTLYVSKK